MVLYPIPPGGGRRRAGSRPDWRISADSDPIATGPGQGPRACDLSPRYRISGRAGRQRAAGRQAAGSGQRAGRQRAAGRRAADRVPGRSIACRAAGRMFCLRAGQAGSGHKKTPGEIPRGVVRGQRARFRSDPRWRPVRRGSPAGRLRRRLRRRGPRSRPKWYRCRDRRAGRALRGRPAVRGYRRSAPPPLP
jgi:hypothetical protein